MTKRPWGDASIKTLEEMFDHGRANPEVLESLFAEVSNRKSNRARELRERIIIAAGWLTENFKKEQGREPGA